MSAIAKAEETGDGKWRFRRRAAGFAAVVLALAFALSGLRDTGGGNNVYRGRMVRDWVQDALDDEGGQEHAEARTVVISELRERAVPLIVKRVRAECHSRLFYTLLRWQLHLPRFLWLLSEPEPRGKIVCASHLLSEMGESARPAAAVLGRSLRQSGMHIWEAQEVMTDLIGMGPVAKGAAPWLREIAASPRHWQYQSAALALYTIEGDANTLAQVINNQLQTGTFEVERELFWFRGFEDLNSWLVPMLSRAVAEQQRGERERKAMIWHLGELETTNQLVRTTLEALVQSEPEGSIKTEAREALEQLRKRETNHTSLD